MRKILHVDMDAFYAQVEQRDRPEYRNKPIAVGSSMARGVVATASYEARKFGVQSAMPSITAKQKCPSLIFAPPRFDVYKTVSQEIREIFSKYTTLIEPLSLDEAFLDITDNIQNHKSALETAKAIQNEILETLSLTCSIGISYNKFLAKIASDLRKPNGISTISAKNALTFLDTLPIDKFFGIGKKTAEKMHALNIQNGKDLRQLSREELIHHFGKAGERYYFYARGEDDRPVNPNRERKSVGVEDTFLEDITIETAIEFELKKIIKELVKRLEQSQFRGYTLTLKIKYHDFMQITRSKTFNNFIPNHIEFIYTQTLPLFTSLPEKAIRLMGVTISNPDTMIYEQLSFEFI